MFFVIMLARDSMAVTDIFHVEQVVPLAFRHQAARCSRLLCYKATNIVSTNDDCLLSVQYPGENRVLTWPVFEVQSLHNKICKSAVQNHEL